MNHLLRGLLVLLLPAGLSAAVVPAPSQPAIDAAVQAPLISYRRSFSGGAHTNGAWFGGASVVLAVASHAGNASADGRLLQQIRHTLTPGNEPTCSGGYPSQHERHVTGMFVIAKHTPRIWDQLSDAEKERIGRIMKAAFVASAFTTSDNNPYVKAGTQQLALDGDTNLNRGWNPNYREGMIGGILAGLAYFGGPAPATAVLSAYDHDAFVAELLSNNLPNSYETFNWKVANPTSSAPSSSAIEPAVNAYSYYGSSLSNYMTIYDALLSDTYGRKVNAGLNGGAGISGSGKIASGADTLPNPGASGMLKEFDSTDANGPRSSFIYSYDGYRPHTTNQLALIVSGLWLAESAVATKAAALMNIGNTDLWYKAEKGYLGYAKGKAQSLVNYSTHGANHGFAYNRSLWEDVLKPFHGLSGGSPPPAEFAAGARVQAAAASMVRLSPSSSAASAGTVAAGTVGSILGGPVEADALIWWQVRFDNGVEGWLSRGALTPAPVDEYLALSAGQGWGNRPLPPQSGTFEIAFNLRPGEGAMDGLAGISGSAASGYSQVAAAVRVSPAGTFDARDGGSYRALASLAYQPGELYRVVMAVNLSLRTYTVTVVPPGAPPVVVARDFAFRSEQSAVTQLANLAVTAQTGSIMVSGVTLSSGGPPSAPRGLRVVPN